MLDGLFVAHPSVQVHDDGGHEVEEGQALFSSLARIANDLVAFYKSKDAQHKENAGDPEVGVFIPNGFRDLLLAHKNELYRVFGARVALRAQRLLPGFRAGVLGLRNLCST